MKPGFRQVEVLRAAFLLCVFSPLSACAVGNVGTLAARVAVEEGARVIDVYAPGAHLRTRPDDAGLSVGLSRRTYVFPAFAEAPKSPVWHFVAVPVPKTPSVASDVESLGLDISTVPSLGGVAVGYDATTVYARVPDNASVSIRIDRGSRRLRFRGLEYCREGVPC